MFPVVTAMFSAMIVAWYLAPSQPKELAARTNLTGDVLASNFWSYRKSVANYQAANPGASGTVADASLTFEMGYMRYLAWTNTIQSGILYTYSNAPLPPNTINAIANRGGRSLVIGIAQLGATMTSVTGGASNFSIPAAIPVGAIVVIGN